MSARFDTRRALRASKAIAVRGRDIRGLQSKPHECGGLRGSQVLVRGGIKKCYGTLATSATISAGDIVGPSCRMSR
jgi:hypothetical protein